jgi:hypothetical protein
VSLLQRGGITMPQVEGKGGNQFTRLRAGGLFCYLVENFTIHASFSASAGIV